MGPPEPAAAEPHLSPWWSLATSHTFSCSSSFPQVTSPEMTLRTSPETSSSKDPKEQEGRCAHYPGPLPQSNRKAGMHTTQDPYPKGTGRQACTRPGTLTPKEQEGRHAHDPGPFTQHPPHVSLSHTPVTQHVHSKNKAFYLFIWSEVETVFPFSFQDARPPKFLLYL